MNILKTITILTATTALALISSIAAAACSKTTVKITNDTASQLIITYPNSTTHGKWTKQPKKVSPGESKSASGQADTDSTHGFQSHLVIKQNEKKLCEIKLNFPHGLTESEHLKVTFKPSKSFCENNGVTKVSETKGNSCQGGDAQNAHLHVKVSTN